MTRFLTRFANDESGATAIEYGMIMGLIFLVIIGAITALGSATENLFNSAMNALRAAMGG